MRQNSSFSYRSHKPAARVSVRHPLFLRARRPRTPSPFRKLGRRQAPRRRRDRCPIELAPAAAASGDPARARISCRAAASPASVGSAVRKSSSPTRRARRAEAKQAMQTAGGRPPTGARCSTSRSAAGCSCRYRSQGPPIRHLKIASVIVREFDGKMHEVVVAPGGFYWSGQTYASQSAIARKVTGTSWNGPRFFGLRGTSEPAQAELEVNRKAWGRIRGRVGLARIWTEYRNNRHRGHSAGDRRSRN